MNIEDLKIGDEVFVKGVISDKTFNIHGNKKFKIRTTPFEDINGFVAKNKLILPDQPKPVVPQVAIDYYNEYKNVLSSFDEWFCGFYDDKFDEEFEKAEELRIWLYDNDNKINLQHELALATLIVNGPDAVTVEKEKLFTVEIPDPNSKDTVYCLFKDEDGQVKIGSVLFLETESDDSWRDDPDMQLTEQEIRKDFDWAWQWKKEVRE